MPNSDTRCHRAGRSSLMAGASIVVLALMSGIPGANARQPGVPLVGGSPVSDATAAAGITAQQAAIATRQSMQSLTRATQALQAMQAYAMNHAFAIGRCFNAHAQLRKHGGGRTGVFTFEKATHMRAAFGQRGKHQGTMRYGLVAGYAHLPVQRMAGAALPIQARAHGKATG